MDNNNKKTLRNLLLYLGIPIVIIIVIASIYGTRRTTTQKYSEIVNQFAQMNVKEYSMDLGNGEMQIILQNGDVIKYVAPDVGLLYNDVKPYMEQYDKEHPDSKMVFDLKRPAQTSWLVSMLPTLLIFVLGIFFWLFMMRRLNSGMGDEASR